MRYSIKRDKKLREKYANNEKAYTELLSLFHNRYLDEELREVVRYKLSEKGGLITKVKNRCVITGRSRGVLRKYKMSRITFKELASAGYLPGIRKSSW